MTGLTSEIPDRLPVVETLPFADLDRAVLNHPVAAMLVDPVSHIIPRGVVPHECYKPDRSSQYSTAKMSVAAGMTITQSLTLNKRGKVRSPK